MKGARRRPDFRAAWANLIGESAAPPVFDLLGPVSDATLQRLTDLGAETPVPAGRTAKPLRIARIDDLAFTKNAVLSLPDIRWPDSIRYGFVELTDAIVTPFGFVIKDDCLIFNTQILPNGWMKGAGGGSSEIVRRIFQQNSIP